MACWNFSFVHVVPPGETNSVVAGRFRVSRTGTGIPRGEFVYGRSWLRRPNAVELDPGELVLGEGVRETVRLGGFCGAIRDAMPDAWGRRLIERQSGHHGSEEFDFLRFGDADRGRRARIQSRSLPCHAGLVVPGLLALHALEAAARAVLTGKPHPLGETAHDLLFPGTSLGGARPKATIEDAGNLWLAKFGQPGDEWDESRVEHALLRLAARCGLRAAESRVATVGERSVLLVRRFDHEPGDSGMFRWRFASGLTLLRAEDNATARDRWSYLLLADEIRPIGTHPRRDLRELFGRMCLGAAVRNTDDHPRNHAMIAGRGGWRLSPAYDLTPSPGPSREPPWLAMDCGFEGRRASRTNLLGGAGRPDPAPGGRVHPRFGVPNRGRLMAGIHAERRGGEPGHRQDHFRVRPGVRSHASRNAPRASGTVDRPAPKTGAA